VNCPKEIVIVGAGNVAWHLGKRLVECGLRIAHVHARSESSARHLAKELGCSSSQRLRDIPRQADLYLVMVNDAEIATVAKSLAGHIDKNSLLLHTSGATPAHVFQPFFERYGVFYPLQTFSKKRELDFSQVPLCLCTHRKDDFEPVFQLAKKLSEKVYSVSDEQRLRLHLAAIYVNNFTNYLQYIGESLLDEQGLSAEMLHPLQSETIAKLKELSAKEAQTGPAVRGDDPTIDRHLSQLDKHPNWRAIYQLLSDGIQKDLAN
jgi:predicted short-subunit dehydrogenase-like oxidoreductase (DUF2520 family)